MSGIEDQNLLISNESEPERVLSGPCDLLGSLKSLTRSFETKEPYRTDEKQYMFHPLNFSKYTNQEVFIEDKRHSSVHRPINKKYLNTDNIIISSQVTTGMVSGKPFDSIEDEDIEKVEDFLYIVTIDEFIDPQRLRKSIICNTAPFKFEESSENILGLGECTFLELIPIKTYKWDTYMTEKDFIHYYVYSADEEYYGCDMFLDKQFLELLEKREPLDPKEVFNLGAFIYDKNFMCGKEWETHLSQFIDKEGLAIVSHDGNKLKDPVPRSNNKQVDASNNNEKRSDE